MSAPPAAADAPASPGRPRPWRRRGLALLGAVGLLGALAAGAGAARLLPIGAAFQAKQLAAWVHGAGRAPEAVLAEDLAPGELSALLRLCRPTLDPPDPTGVVRARSRVLGLVEREVVFRPGLGATVAIGEVAPVSAPPPVPPPADPAALWPEGERVDPAAAAAALPGLDRARLEAALDRAFAEPEPDRPRRTRAVVVVAGGRVVAERYAPGFHADMPLLGWSATKTVAAALVGVLVRDGRWELDRSVPVPEWGPGDPRAAITLRQLLQMQSGLEFAEVYSPLTDVTSMLFGARDAGGFAASKPLAHPPGTAWSYSSGTTNILCRAMRATLGDDAYWRLPRDALFAPLGMRSARIELDAAGHFVGSSFGWATARDWARFGLLWVQDGVWQGRRLLPPGWVELCRTPAEHSDGQYGGHVWLRLRSARLPDVPALPADAFHASGHEGQVVTMVPSRGLVVVRLGLSRHRNWVQEHLMHDVLEALGPGG